MPAWKIFQGTSNTNINFLTSQFHEAIPKSPLLIYTCSGQLWYIRPSVVNAEKLAEILSF